MELEALGWADPFKTAMKTLTEPVEGPALAPARVAAAQRERYRLLAEDGAYDAQLAGRLRHDALPGELPVVGDWVAAALRPEQGAATIAALLPRRTALVRKQVERSSAPQVLAANVDVVFLMTSLNRDFNPRRIERALALIWESGAQPVVLLSKLDLCPDDQARELCARAQAVALGADVHALSSQTGAGLDALAPYLRPARTAALIGSSGVGKSTLVNRLLAHERLATAAVRESDDRGRHTTTARELFVLAGGALLIDTPGMREIGLFDASDGVDAAFDDIDALAGTCRFGDCTHEGEPGCAILAAVRSGELDAARVQSYRKLQRELAYEERRRDPRALAEYRERTRRVFRARKRALRRNPKQ